MTWATFGFNFCKELYIFLYHVCDFDETSAHAKKCIASTKKHFAVPAILLTILTINMVDLT